MRRCFPRKGTNGVSTNGVTAKFMFFDRDFWGTPVDLLYLPKSARAYIFPQSVRIHYFCSGPSSVDPICPQPISGRAEVVGSAADGVALVIVIVIVIVIVMIIIIIIII